jgi:hypothetical protein
VAGGRRSAVRTRQRQRGRVARRTPAPGRCIRPSLRTNRSA